MKSTGLAYLLWCCCFLGFCGIHRFYNGKWITGLIWFFTGGLFLIGQIIDLFLIPGMTERAEYRVRLRQERINSRVAQSMGY
ncbi:MAG: NINE protein [Phycisphaerales bacterium]|nr:NINE protein [Phycisphaerales bacterium]